MAYRVSFTAPGEDDAYAAFTESWHGFRDALTSADVKEV